MEHCHKAQEGIEDNSNIFSIIDEEEINDESAYYQRIGVKNRLFK